MKTRNVEIGPSAQDAGIPQPRDKTGKFTIKHYIVLPYQKSRTPRIRCKYCPFDINHNITRMEHHLTGLKTAPPKASTTLIKKGEKNQQTCQFVPIVVREELTRLMSVQEHKSGVEGDHEHYKACKVEPEEGYLRPRKPPLLPPASLAIQILPKTTWSSTELFATDLHHALLHHLCWMDRKVPVPCLLLILEPERRMPSRNDIRYVLLGPKKLSNDLLNNEFEEVKKDTEKLMFPPQGFSKLTLTCNGWTNIQGRPLMNVMVVNKYGEMFHSSVDCRGIYKDAKWEADELMKMIEELEPENVLQFVANNAAVNRKAGDLIREKYPHIVSGGCVAHGLNLLAHDLGE
ncbi:hypothetical protein R1sor_007393 [Riccia sorocarpa]|uniref:DUF659 domain-containing protein n=1 Tax=Riccia sorocarpa TaxID=122646 RepID=A0ABD3HT95_9MARC